jgi:hypothetical protein
VWNKTEWGLTLGSAFGEIIAVENTLIERFSALIVSTSPFPDYEKAFETA